MTTRALLLLAVLCVAACAPERKAEKPKVEFSNDAITQAWAAALEQGRQIGERTTDEAMRAARAKAVELRNRLAEVKVPSELQSLQLDTLRAEIDKIDAALVTRSIESRLRDAKRELEELKRAGLDKVEDGDKKLAELDLEVRQLSEKLSSARRTYSAAAARLEEMLDSMQDL